MGIHSLITRIRQGALRRRIAKYKLSETEREEQGGRSHVEREDMVTERKGEDGEGEGDERHEERHERQTEAKSYDGQENMNSRWPEELLIQILSDLDVTFILRCRQVRSLRLFGLPRLSIDVLTVDVQTIQRSYFQLSIVTVPY
jgi:hypothetical protein